MSHKYYLLSCNICSKSFVDQKLLDQHYLVHNEVINTFNCQKCPRKFLHAHQLEKHKEFHRSREMSEACDKSLHNHAVDKSKLSCTVDKSIHYHSKALRKLSDDLLSNDKRDHGQNANNSLKSGDEFITKTEESLKNIISVKKQGFKQTKSSIFEITCGKMRTPHVKCDGISDKHEHLSRSGKKRISSEKTVGQESKSSEQGNELGKKYPEINNSINSLKNQEDKKKTPATQLPNSTEDESQNSKPDFDEIDAPCHAADENFNRLKFPSFPKGSRKACNQLVQKLSCDADVQNNNENICSNINEISSPNAVVKKWSELSAAEKAKRLRKPSKLKPAAPKTNSLLSCESIQTNSNTIKKPVENDSCSTNQNTAVKKWSELSAAEKAKRLRKPCKIKPVDAETSCEKIQSNPTAKTKSVEFEIPEQSIVKDLAEIMKKKSDLIALKSEAMKGDKPVTEILQTSDEAYSPLKKKRKNTRNIVKNLKSLRNANEVGNERKHKNMSNKRPVRPKKSKRELCEAAERPLSDIKSGDTHESKAGLKWTCDNAKGNTVKKTNRKSSEIFADGEYTQDEDEYVHEVSELSMSDIDSSSSDGVGDERKKEKQLVKRPGRPKKHRREPDTVAERPSRAIETEDSQKSRAVPKRACDDTEGNAARKNNRISPKNVSDAEYLDDEDIQKSRTVQKFTSNDAESNALKRGKRKSSKNISNVECLEDTWKSQDTRKSSAVSKQIGNDVESNASEKGKSKPLKKFSDAEIVEDKDDSDYELSESSASDIDPSSSDEAYIPEKERTPPKTNEKPKVKRKYVKHKTGPKPIIVKKQPWFALAEPVSNFENNSCNNNPEMSPSNTVVKKWSELSPAERAKRLRKPFEIKPVAIKPDFSLSSESININPNAKRKPVEFEMPEDLFIERKKNKLSIDVQKRIFSLKENSPYSNVQPKYQQTNRPHSGTGGNTSPLPVSSMQNDSQVPASSIQNDPQLAASSMQNDPQLPASSMQNYSDECPEKPDARNVSSHDMYPKSDLKNPKHVSDFENDSDNHSQEFSSSGTVVKKWSELSAAEKAKHLRKPVEFEMSKDLLLERKKNKLSIEVQKKFFSPKDLKSNALSRYHQINPHSVSSNLSNLALDSPLNARGDLPITTHNELAPERVPFSKPSSGAAPNPAQAVKSLTEKNTKMLPSSFPNSLFHKQKNKQFLYVGPEQNFNKVQSLIQDMDKTSSFGHDRHLGTKVVKDFVFVKVTPEYMEKMRNQTVEPKLCVKAQQKEPRSVVQNSQSSAFDSFTATNVGHLSSESEPESNPLQDEIGADTGSRSSMSSCPGSPNSASVLIASEQKSLSLAENISSSSVSLPTKECLTDKTLENLTSAPNSSLSDSQNHYEDASCAAKENRDLVCEGIEKAACSQNHAKLESKIEMTKEISTDLEKRKLNENAQFNLKKTTCREMSSVKYTFENILGLKQNEIASRNSFESAFQPAFPNSLISESSNIARSLSGQKHSMNIASQNAEITPVSHISITSSLETGRTQKTVLYNTSNQMENSFHPDSSSAKAAGQIVTNSSVGPNHSVQNIETDIENVINSIINKIPPDCFKEKLLNLDCSQQMWKNSSRPEIKNSYVNTNQNNGHFLYSNTKLIESQECQPKPLNFKKINLNNLIVLSGALSLKAPNGTLKKNVNLEKKNYFPPLLAQKQTNICKNQDFPQSFSCSVKTQENHQSNTLQPQHYTNPSENFTSQNFVIVSNRNKLLGINVVSDAKQSSSANSSDHLLGKTDAVSIISQPNRPVLPAKKVSLTSNSVDEEQTMPQLSADNSHEELGLPYIVDVRSIPEPQLELSPKILRRYKAKLEEKEHKKREKYELKKRVKCLQKLLGKQFQVSSLRSQGSSSRTSGAPKQRTCQGSISVNDCLNPSEVRTLKQNPSTNPSSRLLDYRSLIKVDGICSVLLNTSSDTERLLQLHDLQDVISKNNLWRKCHSVFKALRVCRLKAESICVKEFALSLHKSITKALKEALSVG